MGRLTKKKIDEIRGLRKQGYCQKEIAEKVRVHVKTVRKYDPTSKTRKHHTLERQIETIEQALAIMLDWLKISNPPSVSIERLFCPRCQTEESLYYDVEEEVFTCSECGFKLAPLEIICPKCFSYDTLSYDMRLGRDVCEVCERRNA
jgi:predicted transcriptional regulator